MSSRVIRITITGAIAAAIGLASAGGTAAASATYLRGAQPAHHVVAVSDTYLRGGQPIGTYLRG